MLCFAFFVVLCLYSSLSDARKCRLQPRQQHVLSISSGPSTDATSPTPTARPSSTPPSTSNSISSSGSAPTPPPRSFVYGTDKIRGVNLGGWLVLEPWITPSVFERTGNDDIIDEYTLGQLLDRSSAESLLRRHWETWITEDDFVQIKAAGLNHVRIPIGYWSIPVTSSDTRQNTSPAPYIPGAWPYLLRALSWAKKHGINTIIDLHGAPGSQNGYDNSGQRTGDPVWGQNPANVSRTVDALRVLAREAGSQIDVVELLNEAAGFRGETWQTSIRQFWLDAYDAVRNVAGEDIKVMIGDAFMGVNSWQNFLTPPRGHGVMMDFHEYQIFSDLELDRSLDEHLQFTCGYMQSIPPFSSNPSAR